MSAVFYHNAEQKKLAEDSLKVARGNASKPIQTQILEATTFYDAEE